MAVASQGGKINSHAELTTIALSFILHIDLET